MGVDRNSKKRPSRTVFWIVSAFIVIAVAIAVGVGVGFTVKDRIRRNRESEAVPISLASTTTDSTVIGSYWKPKVGQSWQIVLLNSSASGLDRNLPVDVYDIDLFDTPQNVIDDLHGKGKKVICYFSAGSYENWRPDKDKFKKQDYGKKLDGWRGEWWLNVKSTNVRNIMVSRLDLAKQKKCDAVDPDNIDGYSNDSGFNMVPADGADYVKFLANEAHSRGMASGLKNGGAIVDWVVDTVDFEVNEQCEEFTECDTYRHFIDAGKPVFHIEYPKKTDDATVKKLCSDASAKGFSTLIKKLNLDNFVISC